LDSTELDSLEQSLGISLPHYYRDSATQGRLAGLLNADAQSVAAINNAFRSGEFGDEGWPVHIFAFADNGAGDFYCLDISSPGSEVLFRDHETLEREREADDFDEWLASIEPSAV
jgi:hypothetical protein